MTVPPTREIVYFLLINAGVSLALNLWHDLFMTGSFTLRIWLGFAVLTAILNGVRAVLSRRYRWAYLGMIGLNALAVVFGSSISFLTAPWMTIWVIYILYL